MDLGGILQDLHHHLCSWEYTNENNRSHTTKQVLLFGKFQINFRTLELPCSVVPAACDALLKSEDIFEALTILYILGKLPARETSLLIFCMSCSSVFTSCIAKNRQHTTLSFSYKCTSDRFTNPFPLSHRSMLNHVPNGQQHFKRVSNQTTQHVISPAFKEYILDNILTPVEHQEVTHACLPSFAIQEG